jgi:hypothetical protein
VESSSFTREIISSLSNSQIENRMNPEIRVSRVIVTRGDDPTHQQTNINITNISRLKRKDNEKEFFSTFLQEIGKT